MDNIEYKVLSDTHIEKLLSQMESLSREGWKVNYILQEHSYTKVLLDRTKV